MTVESLSHYFRRVADQPDAPPADVLHRIEAALRPFLGLTLEAFAELLGKVKKPKAPPKPKKTDEEKAAEKAEKAEAKRVAKEAEKARKADEAKQKKDDAAAAKLAQKQADAAAKAAAKETAKAAAAEAKLAKKHAAAEAKAAPTREVARQAAEALTDLLKTFPGGGVPKAEVDKGLATLDALGKEQLFHVAQLMDSDAGLSGKSSKPALLKSLKTMVLHVWKTSDNVNH